MQKKLPLGVDSFDEIMTNNYYFVDKSLFIKEILDLSAKVLLLLRPRRFGKTLHLSMLQNFFDINKMSDELFKNLDIWQAGEHYRSHLNKNPVIFISLKGIKEKNWDLAYAEIKSLVANLYQEHRFLIDQNQLTPERANVFNRLLAKNSTRDELKSSLKNLSCLLAEHYNEKVYILIDEYDTPIYEAYLNNYHEDALNFMRGFLGDALKGNASLKMGVVTGILRLAKESLFSGINNLSVFGVLDSNFNSYFGWTESEVKKILQDYDLKEELHHAKIWYDGYYAGKNGHLYNPWSILNFLQDTDHKLKPYWVNTGNPALLRKSLARTSDAVKIELQTLFNGQCITCELSEMLTLGDLNQLPDHALWPLLIYSGYLTAKPMNPDGSYDLCIPNKEVMHALSNIVKEWFDESASQLFLNRMLKQLTHGEIKTFKEMMTDYAQKVLSYFDVSGEEPERFYHALVLGLLVGLRETYEIRSNRESGYGRYDVTLLPNDITKPAVIIEFKKVGVKSKDTLKKAAEEALAQIRIRNYKQELEQHGIKKIIFIGMAFKGKQLHIEDDSYFI